MGKLRAKMNRGLSFIMLRFLLSVSREIVDKAQFKPVLVFLRLLAKARPPVFWAGDFWNCTGKKVKTLLRNCSIFFLSHYDIVYRY